MLLIISLLGWLACFYLNRFGSIVPKIGGGCFGGGGAPPSYTPPKIQLPTATELYNQANDFWKTTSPTLYNAQSNAINNANNPDFYNSFQPSSFQQALGNQYFQNVWPDTQAYMKDQLSKSGFINSPGASQALGNSLGNIETGIGQYLSGIGQQQANTAINAGLSVKLSDLLNPFVQTGQTQAEQQANLTLADAQAQYQNQLNQYQYQQQKAQATGQLIGSAVGLVAAPFTGGASIGLGSQLGSLAGGGTFNPYALALSGAGMLGAGAFGGGSGAVGQGQSFDGWSLGAGGAGGAASPYAGITSSVNPMSGAYDRLGNMIA